MTKDFMRSAFSRRTFGKISGAGFATLAMPTVLRAQEKSIVYAVWGGLKQEVQRKLFFDPFEKETGIRVIDVPGTDLAKLKAMVENNAVEWDIMDIIPAWLAAGGGNGLFEELDYTGINTDTVDPVNTDKYGFGYSTNAKVLAFNTETYGQKRPSSFKDYWDVDNFPGGRGFYDDPRYNLEIGSYIAHGKGSVTYPLDVDRSFAELDKIKPHAKIWWKQWQQIPTLLASNEISLSLSSTPEMRLTMINSGAPIDFAWEGGVLTTDFAAIPKGTKNKAEAMQLFSYLSDPARLAEYANLTFNGLTSTKAYDLVSPDVKPYLPNDRLAAGDLTRIDGHWWAENLSEMTDRWMTWKLI